MTVAYERPRLLIDGIWRETGAGPSIDVVNPSTSEVLAAMP